MFACRANRHLLSTAAVSVGGSNPLIPRRAENTTKDSPKLNIKYFVSLATVCVLSLAGCGRITNSTSSSTASPPTIQTGGTETADFSSTDVGFAQDMNAHHRQAIEMAGIALDPSVRAAKKVANLASEITATDNPEIQLMTHWLTTFGQPATADTTMTSNSVLTSTEATATVGITEMISTRDLSALRTLKGAEFDKTWIETMIRQHQAVLTSANTEIAHGTNPDAINLARNIITEQDAQIVELNALSGS